MGTPDLDPTGIFGKPTNGDTQQEQSPPEFEAPEMVDPRKGAPYKQLGDRLDEFFGGIALVFLTGGDVYCAQVISEREHALVDSWLLLARQNKGVLNALKKLTEGGAWGAVVFSTASIAIPVAQHHGIYPADWPNPWAMVTGTPLDTAAAGENPSENMKGQPE